MAVKSMGAFDEGQPWPPKSEKARISRYTQNRVLWKGKPEERLKVSLGKDYAPQLDDASRFVLNIHKRISTLWADILFGEQPSWNAGDEGSAEDNRLKELLERVEVNRVGYEVALDASIYGDGLFRVGLKNGQATIEAQPPRHWIPVVSPTNIRRVQAHVLGSVIDHGNHHYLLLEVHTRGAIQYRVNKLLEVHAGETGKIGPRVSLASILPEIAAREGVGDAGLEQTGVDDFLIVPVHNLRTSEEIHGRDDYGDLDTIVNGLEERLDEINEILRKHAAPFMYGPESALQQDATGRWGFDTKQKYLAVPDGDKPLIPGYVTWDGRLTDAVANFNLLIDQMYFISETSPAAFGQLKQGLAESGSALKRLMMPVLAKSGRLQIQFDPAMKKAISLAAQLEGADLPAIGSQWRDGLPEDDLEVAQGVQCYRAAGVMSRHEAIRTRHPDWTEKQIAEEIERIDLDEATMAGASGGAMPTGLDLELGGDDDE